MRAVPWEQSKTDIGSALGINIVDVEELCGADPGYLNNKIVSFNLYPKFMS
jgi:hypothetical protein